MKKKYGRTSRRYHKTKKLATEQNKQVTPESFGVKGRKIRKRVWKTKKGWTSSVTLILKKK